MGDDMFSCQGCTRSFCLDIQKKMNVVEKFHLLVRTLNMGDDYNKENVCGVYDLFQPKRSTFYIGALI